MLQATLRVNEALGLDHYQLMSATAFVRFWTLVYVFLDQMRVFLQTLWQRPDTIGKARCELIRRHRHNVLQWLNE